MLAEKSYTIDDIGIATGTYFDEPAPSSAHAFENGISPSTIDAGEIVKFLEVAKDGLVRSGQTDYDTGNGWWIGNDAGTAKFSIGEGGSGSNSLTWNGTSLSINGYVVTTIGTFGGNGADGALAITTGTTTISASSARVLIKNYTSISITGDGVLDFTTPHTNGTFILLKSQGAVTLTSSAAPMVDASAMGAAGGAAVSRSSNGTTDGNGGTSTTRAHITHYTTGAGGAAAWGVSVGTAGAAPSFGLGTSIADSMLLRYIELQCGAGGASGGVERNASSGTVTSGTGGNGGGVLIIECGGAWNFTTAGGISVAGGAGGTGSTDIGGGDAYAYVDGAGGGGGFLFALYNTLTANSGTVTVAGGVGTRKVQFLNLVGTFYGSGSGGSPIAVGTAGTSSASDDAVVSASGAAGYSFIGQNYLYA